MKKLITFIGFAWLAVSLAACSNSGNAPNRGTTTPPLAAATEPPLQGDAGSTHAEDGLRALEQTGNTNRPQQDVIPSNSQSISVDIRAANAYVLNVDTNNVLFQKKSDEPIAPASTAKMLTALTALEYFSLDDTLTVGPEIDLIAADSSKAGLHLGDQLTFRQLLVALLLPSGNDAAYTLAVNTGKKIADGGTQNAIEAFVSAMNQKAREVGAASSNFENPDGYDADGQYTTAFDLAQIAKACLENETLSEIMSSYKISDTWLSGRQVTYHNTNELINPNSRYYYPGAIGLKTGSTDDAGSCLVSAADINGQTYISVVMASSAGIRFTDSLAIFSAIDPELSLPQENNTSLAVAPGGQRRR
ncbi:D-alanyl-D-alanine carboxypeptidase family protein [Paenibacillus physcomitrellae]|uniref:Peptidase S11 D-alanyl-D-alanine carboxypeptidase A N-terminal domain-containing protein n=1 Tax=Paenibacillus physcomitrellae TaxID=1619311 RepID=A0ABQ1G6X2_9BACL|nr:D-alanyl-D-alanine carboxypeptidase [Paenibacillus physcomitrellae]GGA37932.1 hypothetical protein GCM10010917_23960 [Paenibacillus physcomitrellae]